MLRTLALCLLLSIPALAQEIPHPALLTGRVDFDEVMLDPVDSVDVASVPERCIVLRAYLLIDSVLTGVDQIRLTMDNGVELAAWAPTESWVEAFIVPSTIESGTGLKRRELRLHIQHSGAPAGTVRLLIHWLPLN